MLADELSGGGFEEIEVNGIEQVGRVESGEGIDHAAGVQVVAVDFPFGAVTSVKIWGGGGGRLDSDVEGKKSIEGVVEFFYLKLFLGSKVGHLLEGVDAGVGAARTGDFCRGSEDGAQGLFDESLNGNAIGLHLPAAIVRAVICKKEFILGSVHIQRGRFLQGGDLQGWSL